MVGMKALRRSSTSSSSSASSSPRAPSSPPPWVQLRSLLVASSSSSSSSSSLAASGNSASPAAAAAAASASFSPASYSPHSDRWVATCYFSRSGFGLLVQKWGFYYFYFILFFASRSLAPCCRVCFTRIGLGVCFRLKSFYLFAV